MRRLRNPTAALVIVGIAIALLITLFSPFASSSPDGLEKVAEDKAFIDSAKDAPYELIADYVFPWVDNEDEGGCGIPKTFQEGVPFSAADAGDRPVSP